MSNGAARALQTRAAASGDSAKAPAETKKVAVLTVPPGLAAPKELRCELPDGQGLRLRVAEGVKAGTTLTYLQDTETGHWRCVTLEEPGEFDSLMNGGLFSSVLGNLGGLSASSRGQLRDALVAAARAEPPKERSTRTPEFIFSSSPVAAEDGIRVAGSRLGGDSSRQSRLQQRPSLLTAARASSASQPQPEPQSQPPATPAKLRPVAAVVSPESNKPAGFGQKIRKRRDTLVYYHSPAPLKINWQPMVTAEEAARQAASRAQEHERLSKIMDEAVLKALAKPHAGEAGADTSDGAVPAAAPPAPALGGAEDLPEVASADDESADEEGSWAPSDGDGDDDDDEDLGDEDNMPSDEDSEAPPPLMVPPVVHDAIPESIRERMASRRLIPSPADFVGGTSSLRFGGGSSVVGSAVPLTPPGLSAAAAAGVDAATALRVDGAAYAMFEAKRLRDLAPIGLPLEEAKAIAMEDWAGLGALERARLCARASRHLVGGAGAGSVVSASSTGGATASSRSLGQAALLASAPLLAPPPRLSPPPPMLPAPLLLPPPTPRPKARLPVPAFAAAVAERKRHAEDRSSSPIVDRNAASSSGSGSGAVPATVAPGVAASDASGASTTTSASALGPKRRRRGDGSSGS